MKRSPANASPRHWLGRLDLAAPAGERRVRLLEAIAEQGSITRAAKAVPLSYKAAWDALAAMNNLAERPLVERSAGGRQGGGTRLTDTGREFVATYRAIEGEQRRAIERLALAHAPGRAPARGDPQQLRMLLRRMAVRTSARNQFAGTVAQLRRGQVGVEVGITLDAQTRIVAGVTRESAESLALAPGTPVLALVKASSVLLALDELRTSARNHLRGTVSRIVAGPISAEVTLALPAERSVTASITRDSLDRLGLAKGRPASALFKASSVIVVALD